MHGVFSSRPFPPNKVYTAFKISIKTSENAKPLALSWIVINLINYRDGMKVILK